MCGRRRLGALILAAALAAGASVGTALANGIGDLYVATADGVDEVHVASETVVNDVPIKPAPVSLAFSPDGRQLYASAGGRWLTRIDIQSISVADTLSVPADVASLAHPHGDRLAIAIPTRRRLGILDTTDGTLTESAELPGAVDLLAADRRDPRVVAGEVGASWLAVFDVATSSLHTATLDGRIAALSVDRDRGAAYVATSDPNELLRISLDGLTVEWRTALPAAPDGIAALADRVIVAGETALWAVDRDGAASWGTAESPITSLAASDEGRVVYAAEGAAIEAFGLDGRPASRIDVVAGSGPRALAPVPRVSSLGDGSANGSGSANGTGSGNSDDEPKPDAPSTDTIADRRDSLVGGPVVALGAILVGGIILVCAWLVLRRIVRRLES